MTRKLIFCTLLLLVSTLLDAQSIEKRYRSYLTTSGMLHFIGKKRLSKTKQISKFEYDITYVAGKDSATVNFSFITKSPTSVAVCSITNNNMTVNINKPQMMFRDIIKNGYKIRTTTKIAFNELQKLYENRYPFVFSMKLENGISCSATFTLKQWEKESSDIQKVFYSIKN